jgi:hypothetical protein
MVTIPKENENTVVSAADQSLIMKRRRKTRISKMGAQSNLPHLTAVQSCGLATTSYYHKLV